MSRMFWNVEEVNKLRDTFGKFYASITTWLILCWWRTLALEPLIQTISGDRLCSKCLKFTVVARVLDDIFKIENGYYEKMRILFDPYVFVFSFSLFGFFISAGIFISASSLRSMSSFVTL
jgi:hypothetical protein